MEIDHSVAQLLCSRLCHDLVGPVGAINSGIELIAEDGAAEREALELIAMSASQAQRRLAFFRVAFGLGAGGGQAAGEARALARGFMEGGKATLDWPSPDDDGGDDGDADGVAEMSPAALKVALNMILMAVEALPRGGSVSVRVAALDDGLGIAVTAAGQGAALKDDVLAALDPAVGTDLLTARNVHGHFAQVLAGAEGGTIEVSSGDSGGADADVRLAVLLSSATK